MKKILMMLLACCVVLVGCGVKGETVVQTESTTQEEIIGIKNLYETENLVTKTIGDIEYQIPESWDESCKIDGDYTYYYDENMMIMAYVQKMDEIKPFDEFPDNEKQQYKNALLDGMKSGFESYEEIDNSIHTSNNGVCMFRYQANVELQGNKYILDMLVTGGNGKVHEIGILVSPDSVKDYKKEFESLRKSVKSISTNQTESMGTNQEIFDNLKNSLNESSKDLKTNEAMFILQKQGLENSFYKVKEFSSFGDVDKTDEHHNKFVEFSTAIAYFDTHFDEGSVGKSIGEVGWEAIHSLIINDGQFQDKMNDLKTTYELVDSNHLFKEKYVSGQYKVGNDIPEGEYVMFTDYSSGYFGLTFDANGNDIIANENFNYNSIISIRNGEYLELSNCYAVPIEEVVKLPVDKANMFKIGIHLSSGEYKLISDGDSAYYCIYGDDRQDDIVSNDNFSGQSYITVSDGQYLVLSRCHIEQ